MEKLIPLNTKSLKSRLFAHAEMTLCSVESDLPSSIVFLMKIGFSLKQLYSIHEFGKQRNERWNCYHGYVQYNKLVMVVEVQ